ncbi:uncharacterized protein WCC33_016017 [Rhinophrynus dorsalis]
MAVAAEQSKSLDPAKDDLYFEGFLRKRKDTMKFSWSKYWFRLRNTTLYFYTKREAEPTCLRGQYYMCSVQSVREVTVAEVEFPFEIVLKNGKRKLLAAETAELRDVWMKFLWKSMQLPGPGRHKSSCTWFDIPHLMERARIASGDSSLGGLSPDGTLCDNIFETLPGPELPLSLCDHMETNNRTTLPNTCDQQETKYRAPLPHQERDTDSDSDDYDVPRPICRRAESGTTDQEEGEVHMSMNQLQSHSSPKQVEKDPEAPGQEFHFAREQCDIFLTSK